jgi:hypothetical protein
MPPATALMPSILQPKPFIAVMIIPTGVGAAIGGYGGDATTAMNLLASCCDGLITHPNVANAAMFQKLPDNTLYVEGYALDQFLRGQVALQPVRQNRIGVVMDASIPEPMRVLHLNTIDAVRAVYGIDVVAVQVTETPLAILMGLTAAGTSSGGLDNPDVLLAACQPVLDAGAEAIAVLGMMPEADEATEAAYQQGSGVDPIGGLEAIVSHLVSATYGVPCAHAPVLSPEDAMPVMDRRIAPRAASEFITATFLPCVLQGLSRAPRWVPRGSDLGAMNAGLSVADVGAVIVPDGCLGGPGVLAAIEQGIPVVTVAENTTVLGVTAEAIRPLVGPQASLVTLNNYYEVAGWLQAQRLGLVISPAAMAPVVLSSVPAGVGCSV